MRLSDYERSAIKEAVAQHFGPDARVYLFGSRTDDSKRGGDIDLLVETGLKGEDLVMAKLRAMSAIQRRIGDRKIDVVTTPEETDDEVPYIIHKARETGRTI